MNDDDGRDLGTPFEQLRAPRATAGYRERAADLAPRHRARWPQLAAGVLAVAVAVGAAATVVGLRNARQGNLATATGGGPAARTGAAMAFDSASGMTVMYGGVGNGGEQLSDTWEWDGSTWHAVAAGSDVPVLAGPRMVDDPGDGGVLLIGVSAPRSSSAGSGCAAAGSTGSATAPAAAPASPVSTPAAPPPTVCSAPAAPIVVSTEQTWTFGPSGWRHRADVGGGTTAPGPTAQLALDPASGTVVAVQTGFFTACSTVRAPQVEGPCPLAGAAGSAGSSATAGSSSAPAIACPAGSSCPGTCPLILGDVVVHGGCGSAVLTTYTWGGGTWKPVAGAGPAATLSNVLLVTDSVTHRLTMLAASGAAIPACAGPKPTCGTAASTAGAWTWSGAAWTATTVPAGTPAVLLGAAAAPSSNGAVVFTSSGDTLTLTGGTWSVHRGNGPGARAGEAMAAGPGGQVVLFGGARRGVAVADGSASSPGLIVPMAPSLQPGSDTWTFTSAGWTHVDGSPPPTPGPLPPVVCPSPGEGSACIAPEPAQVSPAPNLITPFAAPGATTPHPVPTAP